MKKSELREIVLEAIKGYSKYYPGGETKGGTSDEFGTILRNIALGTPEKGDAVRGNKILDKANPENVARISRGEKPIYEEDSKLSASEIHEFVKNALNLRDYDVDVRLNPAYNEIKLTIKRDPSEEDFNTIIKYLEDNGYTVDYQQSRREGEAEDDRYQYPKIRFK